jgi:hypothetical protein
MRVMETPCLSTAVHNAHGMQPYTAPHVPECHHTTTSGLSERPSATLPTFHYDKKIHAKIAPADGTAHRR